MRIVFQDLKIGLKKDTILKYLSCDALKRFNETNSLRLVCEEICNPQSSVKPSAVRLIYYYY